MNQSLSTHGDNWDVAERHDTDIKKVLSESGCMDDKGRIRQWRGKEVVPAMARLGHNSLDFNRCQCKQEAR